MKGEFRSTIREEVFLGATDILKADFFLKFQAFSNKTFTTRIMKSAFKKAGLIPFNLEMVYDKLKDYGGLAPEVIVRVDGESSSDESEPAFATLPPWPWLEFHTPLSNRERKRG